MTTSTWCWPFTRGKILTSVERPRAREQANRLLRLACLVGSREKNGGHKSSTQKPLSTRVAWGKWLIVCDASNGTASERLAVTSFVLAFSPQLGVRLPKGAQSHHGPTPTVSARSRVLWERDRDRRERGDKEMWKDMGTFLDSLWKTEMTE